jgi:D-tagatose-1,6-bisphosphate aldolase subunit GatZ/KbaZ
MPARHFFRELVASQKNGRARGICSVCSAHRIVLEAAFAQGLRDGLPVLIESTVNQVNQFGGYTGMVPTTWADFVGKAADEMQFPQDRLILGGDHLGPYPWRSEHADAAMKKAGDLVTACVHAGFTKIHVDASMPLGGDRVDAQGALDPRLVAEREAVLAGASEEAFKERRGGQADASPVYVIGTEVPAPGGISSKEETAPREEAALLPLTRVEDLIESVSFCRKAFHDRGLEEAWTRVCAVVAQPGVEYGDQEVRAYDRVRAAPLCAASRALPGMVLEGHSTDYQSMRHLGQLVEDGVAILKVGPALTFALRECLFSLELMERELLNGIAGAEGSDLSGALERAMVADPVHWKDYYVGSESRKARARKYSYSDRSRYYWNIPAVNAAVDRLISNLRGAAVPGTLLSQFLPLHYQAVRENRLGTDPRELLRESVRLVLELYSNAARQGRGPSASETG